MDVIIVRPFNKITTVPEETKISITSSSELADKSNELLEFKDFFDLRQEFEEELKFDYKYEVHSISSDSHKPVEANQEDDEESKSLNNKSVLEVNSDKVPKQSPHWKRIDVRQKKITRGLSSLAKEFINMYLNHDKERKKKFFLLIDKLLK